MLGYDREPVVLGPHCQQFRRRALSEMMSAESVDYVLGGTHTEQQRLVAQAEEFERQGRWLVDQVGVERGWRVLDVGCGPIGILNLLSERVGPEGLVIGLERERRFTEMAKTEIAQRGLTNVRLLQSDGLSMGVRDASLDFAHERLVLINIPNPASLVSEMVKLVRPGGMVAVEDVDDVSWACHPPHASWDILLDTFHTAYRANGGQVFIGRRLPELLRNAGLTEVRAEAHVGIAPPGGYRRTHLLSLLEALRDKVVSLGLLTEVALDDHRQSLMEHLNDPQTIVIDKLLVQAWGRKPV